MLAHPTLDPLPLVRPPRRASPRLTRLRCLLACFTLAFLLAQALGGDWLGLLPHAVLAESHASDPHASLTFASFLHEHHRPTASRGPFRFPRSGPRVPGFNGAAHHLPAFLQHPATASAAPLAPLASSSLAPADSSASQPPPSPLLTNELGTSGQLGFRYPLSLAPNAAGFVPPLALDYSSAGPNMRSEPSVPAPDFGEGWTLATAPSLSISAQTCPPVSGHQTPPACSSFPTYSLQTPTGSDFLLPTDAAGHGPFYQTVHLSALRIEHLLTSSDCFQLSDASGTLYQFGCTPDALQYTLGSQSSHLPYRYDLDAIVAPQQGPTGLASFIHYQYLQDLVATLGVRDAVLT